MITSKIQAFPLRLTLLKRYATGPKLATIDKVFADDGDKGDGNKIFWTNPCIPNFPKKSFQTKTG